MKRLICALIAGLLGLMAQAADSTNHAAEPALSKLPGNGLAQHDFLYSGEWDTRKTNQTVFLIKGDLPGVTGVKIDFFDHEAKEMIDLYKELLRETARQKLLVNFRGVNKPTGEARTWPNELNREAIKGMEASRLADRATHDVTLPFTRLLAGHADYTPVHFGARRANTTWAHQFASAVILGAPLLTYAASPSNLLANPCCGMIKSIPAV